MHDLTNLKKMLVQELENYGKSGSISKASLDNIDKLAHATKNVIKIIEHCDSNGYEEEQHSEEYSDMKVELMRIIEKL